MANPPDNYSGQKASFECHFIKVASRKTDASREGFLLEWRISYAQYPYIEYIYGRTMVTELITFEILQTKWKIMCEGTVPPMSVVVEKKKSGCSWAPGVTKKESEERVRSEGVECEAGEIKGTGKEWLLGGG
ncbi:uncharacterized protein STEHIDRAFT_107201 [Stereum hirsutum FP-91666 SS1]|uniref:uncharacterized protein n=1 Tax=Stereum hirsutum (strain FP-91666) TaxID=721885 RepID=UPI000440F21C|nr:uncharacterized protein STEHIDRAFT_107201 [Stereum hirsutum FP-91666 SS1]EIM92804.1 hypothetical protein STEHIDRAFT_107201 [Stereum hirsutum FP-91666 SS1]